MSCWLWKEKQNFFSSTFDKKSKKIIENTINVYKKLEKRLNWFGDTFLIFYGIKLFELRVWKFFHRK